jgi:PAS domain S-box-containing protein
MAPDPTAEAVLGGIADGVLVLDADRRVVYANPAALAITGYSATDLLGADCAARLEARDSHGKPVLTAGWHPSGALRSVKRIPEQPVTIRTAAGDDVHVSVTGSYRRDGNGRFAGAVVTLRPVVHRDPSSARGMEIVSTVSHELRSPLTSVKGYTSLMLNRWDRLQDDQKQMMLEQVNHDADRVTRLITELLDISRLETGRLVLRRQLVDLPRLAANVVDKVRLEYPDLTAECVFPEDFPKVYADPDKVEQVLTNLVENACKYGSPLGLRIEGEVVDGEVVEADGTKGRVSVRVTDRGEGIPEADLPRVFTKFFRRSVGRPTGSGLGLWISRGLVESHGGELSAESKPGLGATFRFTLPLLDLDKLLES